jgi:hypothetical protein
LTKAYKRTLKKKNLHTRETGSREPRCVGGNFLVERACSDDVDAAPAGVHVHSFITTVRLQMLRQSGRIVALLLVHLCMYRCRGTNTPAKMNMMNFRIGKGFSNTRKLVRVSSVVPELVLNTSVCSCDA